jgi:peroxiredoxin
LALAIVIAVALTVTVVRAHRTANSREPAFDAASASPTQGDALAQSLEAFSSEWASLLQTVDSAANDEERRRLLLRYEDACPKARSLLELARSVPDDPRTVQALGRIVSRIPNTAVGQEAALLILDRKFPEESLSSCLEELTQSESDLALEILRAAYRSSTHQGAKGLAGFSLACLLKTRAERDGWRKLASSRAEIDLARSIFEEIAAGYQNVRVGRGLLGELARAELDELDTLTVGHIAPEIAGTDTDGQPMKLSAYHGKVVVLAFWGNWCSLCRSMLPYERLLVQSMKGRPFALLGVNSDSGTAIAQSLTRDGSVTWRSWSDGGELYGGPIARAWHVQPLPDLFVLDGRGVIRHHIGPRSDDHGPLFFLNPDGQLLHRWQARSEEVSEVAEALVREIEDRESSRLSNQR